VHHGSGILYVPWLHQQPPWLLFGFKVVEKQEKGERIGDKLKKAVPVSKDTRATWAKVTQLEISTSYERDSGKGKGKEKEGGGQCHRSQGDHEGTKGEADSRGVRGVEWGAR
jgi:hypothetical protein